MATQICGKCKEAFGTVEEYLNHTCSKTGFKPTQIEHLGKGFKTISEAALKRGAAKIK